MDDNGYIIGEEAGTVTITARLKNDPLNRKATVRVKVIPLQTQTLTLIPDVESFGDIDVEVYDHKTVLYIDKNLLENGNILPVEAIAEAVDFDNEERTLEPGIKWTSSDTRVATVMGYDDGTADVVLKTDGVVNITAVTKDLAAVEHILEIHICDYAPRLGATSLTLNSNMTDGVSVPLLESYGKAIDAESVKLYEYDKASKSYVEARNLTAAYEDQMLTIQHDGALENGTRKLRLEVNIEGNDVPYTYDMNLKIANKMPAVTVKQLNKLDLLYANSTAELLITAKDAQIENIELHPENTAPFGLVWDGDAGLACVSNQSITAKPNTSLVLRITLEGYDVTIKKTVKLSTVTTKPSLALSAASSTISTYNENIEPITTFSVTDKKTKEPLDLTEYNVYTDADGIATLEYDVSFDCETVTLRLKEDAEGNVTAGTVSVYVQHEDWVTPVKLTHKITLKDTLPTVSLNASTLKLNRALPDLFVGTRLKLNQSNWAIDDVTFKATGKNAAVAEEKIKLDYGEGGIFAEFCDREDLPDKGTYTFEYVVTLDDGYETKLAPKTVKVSVGETAPVVKVGTIKLNNYFGGDAYAEVPVTLTKAEGYQLAAMLIPDEHINDKIQLTYGDIIETDEFLIETIVVNDEFQLYYDPLTGMLRVDMISDNAPNGKHSFELTPVLRTNYDEDPHFVRLKPIKVTVDIYEGKPAVSVSAKGKLDAINPDSCITYTINKTTNFGYYDLWNVELRGEDAELFRAVPEMLENGKYAVVLYRAVNEYGVPAPVVTNKTYNLQLAFYAGWTTEGDETEPIEVAVNSIKVKFTQSSLKFAKIPTLNLYQSSSMPLTCKVELTSPAGAMLDENSISLGSKTAAQFKAAFGDEGELNFDAETGMLTIGVENPGALSYGKSYTVYLDVTPAGSATNVKPTQLKLTVKVFK